MNPSNPLTSMLLAYVIQQHIGLDEAAAQMKSMGVDPAAIDGAVAALKKIQQQHVTRPPAVTDKSSYHDKAWYLGPKQNGHWTHYLENLGDTFGLGQLDGETTDITALLANPLARGSKRKGLVMGNVQSGKTRNYAGVIAKAVDAGYRFVIVLAGIHNNLRTQTQDRLDGQLFGAHGWYPLTTSVDDFEPPLKPSELFRNSKAIYAVVKKNSNRLWKLNEMLQQSVGSEVLRNWPVLIIDDEADQASPNSMAQKNEISVINGHLKALWGIVQTGSYVAYTATPFANVLIDPESENDLFPSDFITSIEPGEGYFGSERVFGISETVDDAGNGSDGLDMVRKIPQQDADSIKPSSNAEIREDESIDLPPSLKDAVNWFIVATAIRRARGQVEHSSMLVHTTHYSAPHFTMRDELDLYLHELRQTRPVSKDAALKEAWDREAPKVAEVRTVPLPTWDEVQAQLGSVLDSVETIVDNGTSKDRLNYSDGKVRTVIAVGGGTLSRGLTLEGLVVSYFTRTSNTYDTLLQMGRWFGYRGGYEDLPRVWVTEGLDKDYAFLARVEKDLRDEIATVSQSEYTPRQLGVRIRCHPGRLMVTAQNKMYAAAMVQLGLSGLMQQTFILDGAAATQKHNQAAVETLVEGAQMCELPGMARRFIARNVGGAKVRDFIKAFRVHEDQAWLGADQRANIASWIESFASGPVWNVVLVSGKEVEHASAFVHIAGRDLVPLDRAPMKDSTPHRINMKAVLSQGDLTADLEGVVDCSGKDSKLKPATLRRLYAKGEGLILVYPLSKDGRKKEAATERIDMPAGIDHDLLAFGVVYPHVNDEKGDEGTFISVKRTWDVPLAVEGDEDQLASDEDVEAA